MVASLTRTAIGATTDSGRGSPTPSVVFHQDAEKHNPVPRGLGCRSRSRPRTQQLLTDSRRWTDASRRSCSIGTAPRFPIAPSMGPIRGVQSRKFCALGLELVVVRARDFSELLHRFPALDRRFEAVVFDWDGTAVFPIAPPMRPICGVQSRNSVRSGWSWWSSPARTLGTWTASCGRGRTGRRPAREALQPERDPTERGPRAGLHDDSAPLAVVCDDRAHERPCGAGRAGSRRGRARPSFGAAADSPVSTDSSHSRTLDSSSRRSAGTMSRSRIRLPGTSSTSSTCCARPSRSTKAVRRICECSASTAFLERNSLRNPCPTLRPPIVRMIPASVVSPTAAETTAAESRSTRRKLRNWRTSTLRKRAPWLRKTFGPTSSSRRRASSPASPCSPLPRRPSTASGPRTAAAARSRCLFAPVTVSSVVSRRGLSRPPRDPDSAVLDVDAELA
jgi:hypothetical protein